MLFKVIGVEKSSGTYQGNSYSGRNLYAAYPDSYHSDRLTGTKVDKIWVPDRLQVCEIAPGDTVEVFYNRFGKVENVVIA